jgi:hypothetical protein
VRALSALRAGQQRRAESTPAQRGSRKSNGLFSIRSAHKRRPAALIFSNRRRRPQATRSRRTDRRAAGTARQGKYLLSSALVGRPPARSMQPAIVSGPRGGVLATILCGTPTTASPPSAKSCRTTLTQSALCKLAAAPPATDQHQPVPPHLCTTSSAAGPAELIKAQRCPFETLAIISADNLRYRSRISPSRRPQIPLLGKHRAGAVLSNLSRATSTLSLARRAASRRRCRPQSKWICRQTCRLAAAAAGARHKSPLPLVDCAGFPISYDSHTQTHITVRRENFSPFCVTDPLHIVHGPRHAHLLLDSPDCVLVVVL